VLPEPLPLLDMDVHQELQLLPLHRQMWTTFPNQLLEDHPHRQPHKDARRVLLLENSGVLTLVPQIDTCLQSTRLADLPRQTRVSSKAVL